MICKDNNPSVKNGGFIIKSKKLRTIINIIALIVLLIDMFIYIPLMHLLVLIIVLIVVNIPRPKPDKFNPKRSEWADTLGW